MRKFKSFIGAALLLSPASAFAVETTAAPSAVGVGSLADFYTLVQVAANWLVVFGIIIGAVFIIVGGIQYMTAGGNEEGTKAAKAKIIGGLIGIAIVLLAYAVVRVVGSFFGATVLP
jgi:predicted small integral membrane protein